MPGRIFDSYSGPRLIIWCALLNKRMICFDKNQLNRFCIKSLKYRQTRTISLHLSTLYHDMHRHVQELYAQKIWNEVELHNGYQWYTQQSFLWYLLYKRHLKFIIRLVSNDFDKQQRKIFTTRRGRWKCYVSYGSIFQTLLHYIKIWEYCVSLKQVLRFCFIKCMFIYKKKHL